MVGVTKIQRGNAGYWLAAVAQGGDDYYTKPGEAPGEWVGDLVDELGLTGQVDAAGYTAILEGRDPTTGALLVQRPETRYRLRPDGSEKVVEPVLGYDVRFSAPKSVSLLYALAGEPTRERIVSVMNEAVREGIAHLEQEACMVQRGKGGKIIERGGGFAGMAFRHRMSRAGDPALHVHVVISNLTRAAADGKWLSLASPKGRSPLFPHGKSAGIVFQAALRAGLLREFGLEFGAVKNGYADLKGFSREVIEVFSTRSREIAAWLEEHGAAGAKAAQTAAYRTRDAKDHGVDPDAKFAEWEAQAAPYGLTRQAVEEMVRDALPREPRPIRDRDVADAIKKVEHVSSHFDRRALLWAIAEQLPEGGDRRQLSDAVRDVLASGRVTRIYEAAHLLDSDTYTTPRIAELERRFIHGALAGVDAGAAVVDPSTVEGVLARRSYLGEDQREMVIRLTSGGERVVAVAAWPGTGKTTALEAAAEAWTEAGFPVFGCATARTATGELIDAGLGNSFSIASLRYQVEVAGRQLPKGAVIVVDEANVTNTFDLEALRSYVGELGGKLVLIGDPQQIGSIGPGGLYVHLTRVLDAVPLSTIRRQHREGDQRVVTLVHEGRGSDASSRRCTASSSTGTGTSPAVPTR
jgi:conjugative relaxase-like TrwC/TraI family protein